MSIIETVSAINKGRQALQDVIDAGNTLKDKNDPLNGVEFLRGLTNAGSRVLPPAVGIVVRDLANTWSGDLRATGEKIRDANQRIQDAAAADGVPGFPPADPTPPGMEWQPTITVSADGTSFSQGPSRLVPEGTRSSTNEYYDPDGNRIYPPDGGWANPKDPSKPWSDTPPEDDSPGIDPGTGSPCVAGQKPAPRRAPLTLDLDGDGLETVGFDPSHPVYFDHDLNGTKEGTGWVKPDDGFLVLDRNGNGVIDNGSELFGDHTPLSGGGYAADGFAALVQEDTNSDGKVDALDARFANLRVWRDTNQNGISEASELTTLANANIAAINVAKTANSQTLANGNQIADLGTYVKTDGSTGGLGETHQLADINLAADTFHRQFTTSIPPTPETAALPDMRGSGVVRDLREAANDAVWPSPEYSILVLRKAA